MAALARLCASCLPHTRVFEVRIRGEWWWDTKEGEMIPDKINGGRTEKKQRAIRAKWWRDIKEA